MRHFAVALAALFIAGPALAGEFERPWPVVVGSGRAGRVTIAVWSPRLERAIGYAMVDAAESGLGNKLLVQTPWGERRARVVPRRFVDADGNRVAAP